MGQALGAKVIGTVGSDEKMALATGQRLHLRHQLDEGGCGEAGARNHQGAGVPVVYDGVGQATLMASLDSLRPARPAGELWQCLRPGEGLGPRLAFDAGLIVCHKTNSHGLYGD